MDNLNKALNLCDKVINKCDNYIKREERIEEFKKMRFYTNSLYKMKLLTKTQHHTLINDIKEREKRELKNN